MKPNDRNGKLPLAKRRFRVLLDLYARLDLADAWAIIGPVNWYGYGRMRNLKLMFDRLVRMNGGNPRKNLIRHKDPELAMTLEHSPQWEKLSVNHLEGRTAAFSSPQRQQDTGLNRDATLHPKCTTREQVSAKKMQ